jgi:hypothetical protein
MTTYSHTITLDDSERVALEHALKFMIEQCDQEPKGGARKTMFARKQVYQEIWSKLVSVTPRMTSTSSAS